jgi:hypothetical protein
MSTRCNIAIEDPKTKKVKVIYVHCDGYPYGVGKTLVDYWDQPEFASQLFDHGDASYLGASIEECSFYARDWDREIDPAKEYRDEWMYMDAMKGDVFIEYIYIFKDGEWYVSTQKSTKVKDGYDRGTLFYYTKFEPVIANKEYNKHKDSGHQNVEVNMISAIGKALSGKGYTMSVQGGKAKKTN